MSRDGSVGIVTGYWFDGRRKIFFSVESRPSPEPGGCFPRENAARA
jgi:hypothetical protein